MSLNGEWEFALDRTAAWRTPESVSWDARITVPFAPETAASGIGASGYIPTCWYRRALDAGRPNEGRLLLHFGAVDYAAWVWVNGHLAATHEGGYTPFSADITDLLDPAGSQTLVVRADDDPHDLEKPRGKQDWQLEPHSIWYPRTTGIWQTVWLEKIPATSIAALRWSPDVEQWGIGLEIRTAGASRDDLRMRVRLTSGGRTLADDTYALAGDAVARRVCLPDSAHHERDDLLWDPRHPVLIDATVELIDAAGNILDGVESYTAMRSVGVDGAHFLLNGRPRRLRMVLDQGYWPESGMTAPDDGGLRRDVELAKAMGFNAVRKHQKIEDPRYLYWADRLGLMVWQEMPSAYRFSTAAVARLAREWAAAVERDWNHPCIIARVPFNESWGIGDIATSQQQRDYAEALYHLTKALDPSLPVITNDGWEAAARTDMIGIHDYAQDADVLARRYTTAAGVDRQLQGTAPAGLRVTLGGHRHGDLPVLLTEFGGIGLSAHASATWGYSRVRSAEELLARYRALLDAVRSSDALAGFCYTQFADTYQETNGLLYADRTPKAPLEEIAATTRGTTRPRA